MGSGVMSTVCLVVFALAVAHSEVVIKKDRIQYMDGMGNSTELSFEPGQVKVVSFSCGVVGMLALLGGSSTS
jgi:hypothetical protein